MESIGLEHCWIRFVKTEESKFIIFLKSRWVITWFSNNPPSNSKLEFSSKIREKLINGELVKDINIVSLITRK